MSQEAIVKVEGLTKEFGQLKAVDGVSFEVDEGEIFGFLGPNGAGKTTTINMLTTLLRPSGGTALVDGLDIHKHPNEVRRRVGVVPQEYTADEDLTGLQNILLCADMYGIPRSNSKPHAMELLRLVELEDPDVGGPAQPVGACVQACGHQHHLPDSLAGGDPLQEVVEETGPDDHDHQRRAAAPGT